MSLPPGFFYTLPLKYCSQHLRLIAFLSFSHSRKQLTGIPFLCKWFLSQTKGFPVDPNSFPLSIIKELIDLVQEIYHRNIIE